MQLRFTEVYPGETFGMLDFTGIRGTLLIFFLENFIHPEGEMLEYMARFIEKQTNFKKYEF